MGIKLLGSEKFVTNSRVSAGESISAIARVQHNYPAGSEQAVMNVYSDFGGLLDTQNIALEEGVITVSFTQANAIGQNVKVEVQGGDNPLVYATLSSLFTGGFTVNYQAVPAGASGNIITIKYQLGAERGIAVTEGNSIIVTITYETGDTFYDVIDLLDTVSDYFTYSYSGEYNMLSPIESRARVNVVPSNYFVGQYTAYNTVFMTLSHTSYTYRPEVGGYIINEDKTVTQQFLSQSSFNFGGCEGNRELVVSYYPYAYFSINGYRYALRLVIWTLNEITGMPVSSAGFNLTTLNTAGYSRIVVFDETHGLVWNYNKIQQFEYNVPGTLTITGKPEYLTGYNVTHKALLKIDGTHFVIACNIGNVGYIKTYSVDFTANTITEIDSETIEAAGIFGVKGIICDGRYIFHYGTNVGHATLKSVEIDGSYNISIIDTQIHATDGYYPVNSEHYQIKLIDNNHFLISYSKTSEIVIKTFYIDSNGENITEYKSATVGSLANHFQDIFVYDNNRIGVFYNDIDGDLKSIIYDLDIADDFNLEAKEEHLSGGFTPELEVKQITFQNNSISALPLIPSEDGTITITGEDTVEFDFPCRGGIETVITCDISSTGTTTRPSIIIMKEDDIIDSDTAIADENILSVKVVPEDDGVYKFILSGNDSEAGAETEFSNIMIDYLPAVINADGEIYPVIFRTGREKGEKSMTYLEVKQEILSRLDIEITNSDWLARAVSAIDAGIKRLIRERLSDSWQWHGLHVVEHMTIDENGEVEVGGATSDLSSGVFMIRNVFSNAGISGSASLRYVQKSTNFMGLLNTNPKLDVVDDEIYYYRVGDKVYFYPAATAKAKKVTIEYIKEPWDFSDGDEMLDVFSYEFMEDVIDVAEERLRREFV